MFLFVPSLSSNTSTNTRKNTSTSFYAPSTRSSFLCTYTQPIYSFLKRTGSGSNPSSVSRHSSHSLISASASSPVSIPDYVNVGPPLLPIPDTRTIAQRAKAYMEEKLVPPHVAFVISEWYVSYLRACKQYQGMSTPLLDTPYDDLSHEDKLKSDLATKYTENHFSTLLELCKRQFVDPLPFGAFARYRRTGDFDYYAFGINFARALVDMDKSKVLGHQHMVQANQYLQRGENVVWLANHQSEGDPHAFDLLLRKVGLDPMAQETIFMAGDRVRDDVMVAPFSLGRNLLTVYSKKHINDVPELREDKQNHNRKTMKETELLFKQGGYSVWFAPSGGRDRRSIDTKKVELAPFDPDSVEMFRFVAKRAKTPTHFFPMAMATYSLMPPPEKVEVGLGEKRAVRYGPLHIAAGPEIDFDQITQNLLATHTDTSQPLDKEAIRKQVAAQLYQQVQDLYTQINGYEQ